VALDRWKKVIRGQNRNLDSGYLKIWVSINQTA